MRSRQREWQIRKKAEGRCTQCGKSKTCDVEPPAGFEGPKHSLCNACRSKDAKRDALRKRKP